MLTAKQRSFLSGQVSTDSIVTHFGKSGLTEAFLAQLDMLLARHELVKVRFVNFKDEKKTIAADMALGTKSELVRLIGNTAIFFRQNPDPEKRLVVLP